jgi:hypothetical protein
MKLSSFEFFEAAIIKETLRESERASQIEK